MALAVAGWALASRYLPISNHIVVLTTAVSPYLSVCGAVSAALLILARRWIGAIVAIGLTASMVAVQVPLYLRSAIPPASGVAIRVMSANLYEGRADPEHLVSSARERADVLGFQELTPDEVDRLTAAGLDATYPYRLLDAREGPLGVGLWSRFPIHTTRRIDGYTDAFVSAQLRIPGILRDPTVVVLHIPAPWPWPIDDWRRDLDQLPQTLQQVARTAADGAVVVAADLNSTTDMRPFRNLLRGGYADAAEQSGAGILPTFPANKWYVPPFLTIDHILTRSSTTTSVGTMPIDGSDHRALLATVQIPR